MVSQTEIFDLNLDFIPFYRETYRFGIENGLRSRSPTFVTCIALLLIFTWLIGGYLASGKLTMIDLKNKSFALIHYRLKFDISRQGPTPSQESKPNSRIIIISIRYAMGIWYI